jgi:hypothetical protein
VNWARRSAVALAAATVLLGVTAGPGVTDVGEGSPPKAAAGQDPPSLDWTPCADNAECATLPVPLDYAHPDGKTIEIALLRTRASDPSRRVGSLLVNPGGPGDAGRPLALTLRDDALAAGGSDAEISGGDPLAGFDALLQSLDGRPLAASSQPGRSITQNQLVATTALVLSGFPATQGVLERLLAQAQAGDASGFASTYDSVFEIRADGTRANLLEANTAIVCLDSRWQRGAAGYDALITRLNKASPRFGQTFQAGQLPCAYWPVKPKPPRAPVAKGARPILVVGSTGDPLTAYADAEAMAKQLSSGVLLTRNGPGHIAYGKSPCIDDAVNAYLIDLQVPALGTTCP